MVECVLLYKKKLKKHLHCTCATRQKLLVNFDRSLRILEEEKKELCMQDLERAFGSPEEMAQILMNEVCNEEKKRYYQFQTIKRLISLILAVTFILLTVYVYILKEQPMDVYDEAYDITETLEGEY